MEKRFYKDDFEDLVKTSADQYRMFPSERVWNGINNRLHTRRRWYGAGLAFLLLSIGTVTWVMFTNPASNKKIADYKIPATREVSNTKSTTSGNSQEGNEIFIAPKAIDNNKTTKDISNSLPGIAKISSSQKEEKTPSAASVNASESNVVASKNVPVPPIENSVIADFKPSVTTVAIKKAVLAEKKLAQTQPKINTNVNDEEEVLSEDNSIITAATEIVSDKEHTKNSDEANKTIEILMSVSDPDKSASYDFSSYGIENLNNSSSIKTNRPKKATWQIYFTPSITNRSLKENKAFIRAARTAANPINSSNPSPSTVTYNAADLENVISHKPDLGFQLGTSVAHRLSKRLSLVTGFQFNVNKYDVKAYGYTTEVATISLNTLGRNSSVSTVTSYRVLGAGYNVDWLRNFYFSASVPVGLEFVALRGKRSYVGIGANLQPTYVLDNKSYLVSTDYKNYAQVPSLTRHWNVNAGAEIFAGIINKKSEWRISPQVRYQTLSSYKNTYPIKENLFDVGVKLGLILK